MAELAGVSVETHEHDQAPAAPLGASAGSAEKEAASQVSANPASGLSEPAVNEETVDWDVQLDRALCRPSRAASVQFVRSGYRSPKIIDHPVEQPESSSNLEAD